MPKDESKKNPWFKFYVDDWRGDTGLRLCSLAARGLWMEMLCIMHEADERGFLTIGGVPVTDRDLAVIVGVGEDEAQNLRKELETRKIFSRNRAGIIYSRKMVRDEKKAQTARENGANNDPTSPGKKRRNPASVTKDTTNGATNHATKGTTNGATGHPTNEATDPPTATRARVPESRSQILENTLDADASNDAAGVDRGKSEFQIITDRIWADAPAFLASRGVPEKQARPVIGKWLKAHRPHDVDRALKAAADSPTRDPIPYVEAILQGDKDDIRAAFKRFWAAYPDGPNKTDQPRAMRSFIEIVTGRKREIPKTDPEIIIAAAQAMPQGDRFTVSPTRWLEGARWTEQNAENSPHNGKRWHPYADHPVLGGFRPESETFFSSADMYFSTRPDEDREWNYDRPRRLFGITVPEYRRSRGL